MYSLKNFDKSYTRTFSRLYLTHEIHLLALLSLLIRPNDRFPKPFHTLQLEISQRPFQYLKPEKSKPFREEHRRIGRYKEYIPLPPRSLNVQGSQEGHHEIRSLLSRQPPPPPDFRISVRDFCTILAGNLVSSLLYKTFS